MRHSLGKEDSQIIEFSYLENMIKIHIEHSNSIVKNAMKYLDPLKTSYEKIGSSNQHFIQSLKDLDTSHAFVL